ncbi:uncharacterized protein PHALS_15176 [Plasmopara halstedii]|uniref:Uncharacterized protein n=1 Tax=Plasmopara halstedii TaxID=4781 RepID=A0A0P1B3X1_PLAHL|nr:uncharacterized protein PHALS_15176 [Plasmopara halstedii]CEG48783.1 hypothetical protein PHALS_15176 [Plasmopara halstedii]|eukprot:XP_024585152.1 hypothetical protein PHALS_15176 [Plasmopara halstedii]
MFALDKASEIYLSSEPDFYANLLAQKVRNRCSFNAWKLYADGTHARCQIRSPGSDVSTSFKKRENFALFRRSHAHHLFLKSSLTVQ